MPHTDEAERIIEQICRDALRKVDVPASYQHFLIWGEVKVIYKEEQKCTENG